MMRGAGQRMRDAGVLLAFVPGLVAQTTAVKPQRLQHGASGCNTGPAAATQGQRQRQEPQRSPPPLDGWGKLGMAGADKSEAGASKPPARRDSAAQTHKHETDVDRAKTAWQLQTPFHLGILLPRPCAALLGLPARSSSMPARARFWSLTLKPDARITKHGPIRLGSQTPVPLLRH